MTKSDRKAVYALTLINSFISHSGLLSDESVKEECSEAVKEAVSLYSNEYVRDKMPQEKLEEFNIRIKNAFEELKDVNIKSETVFNCMVEMSNYFLTFLSSNDKIKAWERINEVGNKYKEVVDDTEWIDILLKDVKKGI